MKKKTRWVPIIITVANAEEAARLIAKIRATLAKVEGVIEK